MNERDKKQHQEGSVVGCVVCDPDTLGGMWCCGEAGAVYFYTPWLCSVLCGNSEPRSRSHRAKKLSESAPIGMSASTCRHPPVTAKANHAGPRCPYGNAIRGKSCSLFASRRPSALRTAIQIVTSRSKNLPAETRERTVAALAASLFGTTTSSLKASSVDRLAGKPFSGYVLDR